MKKLNKITSNFLVATVLSGVSIASIQPITNANVKADNVTNVLNPNISVKGENTTDIANQKINLKNNVIANLTSKNITRTTTAETENTNQTTGTNDEKKPVEMNKNENSTEKPAEVGDISLHYQDVIVRQGDNPPDPTSFIEPDSLALLPKGTTVTYDDAYKPDTSYPDNHPVRIKISLPDGRIYYFNAALHVKHPQTGFGGELGDPTKQSGLYIPKGDDIIIPINQERDAADAIVNKQDLPADAKISWKTPVDTTTPGSREAYIIVTYSDGSTDEIKIAVQVQKLGILIIRNNLGDKVITKVGTPVDAVYGVTNRDKLPIGTKVEWVGDVDWNTPWTSFDQKVKITYPRNVIIYVTANISIYDVFTGQDIYVDQNDPVDIMKGIKETEKYSKEIKDFKFEWEKTPDTSKMGVFPAKINVSSEKWNLKYTININVHVSGPWTELTPSTPIVRPTPPDIVNPDKPVVPDKPVIPVVPETPNNDIKEEPKTPDLNKQKPVRQTPVAKKALPKTGEKNTLLVSLFGIVLTVLSLGVFVKLKRSKN